MKISLMKSVLNFPYEVTIPGKENLLDFPCKFLLIMPERLVTALKRKRLQEQATDAEELAALVAVAADSDSSDDDDDLVCLMLFEADKCRDQMNMRFDFGAEFRGKARIVSLDQVRACLFN